MPYTTKEDVEVRLGRTLTGLEAKQVEAWIGDVETQIELRITNLTELLAAGNPTPALVKAVVASAVIRVVRNPEGLRQRTVSLDDYSETKTVDVLLSGGLLYLTDEEWGMLSPGTAGDAFTIRSGPGAPIAGQWVHPDVWVPL